MVSTGNISNADLESLLEPLLPALLREFQANDFIELGHDGLTIRS